MKNLRKILFAVFIISFGVLLSNIQLVCAQGESKKPLHFVDASSNNFPPMNFLDKDGNLTGFGRELAAAVIKEVGGEVEHIHSSQWVEVLEWLDTGKADFIHDTGYTKDRDSFLDYSDPIIEMPEAIFVRTDEYSITNLDSLKGKRVASVNKHITHLYLQQFPEISLFVVKTPAEGIYELISGRVDAFVYPKQIVLYLVQNLRLRDKVKTTGESLRTLTWSMVVKEGNSEFLRILNEGISRVRKSGEYDRIYNKWWGEKALAGYSKKELVVVTLVVTGASLAVLIAIVLLIFNHNLRQNKKTLEIEVYERKQAEKALQKSEQKFRAIAETSPLAIYMSVGIEQKAEYINPTFVKFFGYTMEDVPTVDEWWPLAYPDENYRKQIEEEWQKKVEAAIEERSEIEPMEVVVTCKDGSKKNILWGFINIGKQSWAFGLNLTEQKQAEEEKNKLFGRLQQAQKMEAIGTLAGGIAHDFNNILSVILGYADMAKEDAPPGTKLAADLGKVVTAGHRAKDLVKQILAFSRQAEVERIPLQLQSIIKEALKMLRASIPTTIEIQDTINSKCGVVLADPTQIYQILMNLCTNANHAMEESGGILKIDLQRVCMDKDNRQSGLNIDPGEYVELTVSDTGSGIEPDIINKIFDPYFTTKELGKGTGMGLAIIHGIIADYGGTITVESKLGKGTTFHVYFPVIDKEESQTVEENEESPSGNERILFIDDEELLAEMGQDMLERLGYRVTVRKSSLDALSTFQNNPDDFDLVITDQTMPGMTGSDLARRILQIKPDMPIILCTGYSNLIDAQTAKSLGIKEYATKPLTKGIIAKLIRKVLDAS